MTFKDVPQGAYAEFDIGYTYDLRNLMLSATSSHGHVAAWDYDGLGQLRSETGPQGTKLLAYDYGGRLIRLTWPGGFEVGYTYLPNGQMDEIREAPHGTYALLADFAYDGHGRRTSLTRGNGAVTLYQYDALDRLIRLEHDLPGPDHDVAWTFTPNPASGIASTTRDNNSYAWQGHMNAQASAALGV